MQLKNGNLSYFYLYMDSNTVRYIVKYTVPFAYLQRKPLFNKLALGFVIRCVKGYYYIYCLSSQCMLLKQCKGIRQQLPCHLEFTLCDNILYQYWTLRPGFLASWGSTFVFIQQFICLLSKSRDQLDLSMVIFRFT